MLSKTLGRLRPVPAGVLAMTALVVGLTFTCAQRAMAAVLVANISQNNPPVPAGAAGKAVVTGS